MLVFLFAEALALHKRIQRKSTLIIHVKIESLFPRRLVHLSDESGPHGLETILNLRMLLDVSLIVQSGRQLLAHVVQRPRKQNAQLFPLPRRNRQEPRTIRILKVVDVQQIGRRRGTANPRRQKLLEHVGTSEIGLARKIDVVSRGPDVQRQLQRPERTRLRRGAAVPIAGNGVAVFPGNSVRRKARAHALTGQRFDFTHTLSVYIVRARKGPGLYGSSLSKRKDSSCTGTRFDDAADTF